MIKKLPAMQETQVWPLGREDPLEKGMTIHSSTLTWRIPWTEKPGRLQSMGSPRIGQDWATNTYLHLFHKQWDFFLSIGHGFFPQHNCRNTHTHTHTHPLSNQYCNNMVGGASGKELACQFRRYKRHGFDPWVRKIPLEEGMTTHSSILAWRIPWTEELDGLPSMGSQRVRHNWSNLARSTQ